jgi:hypothetical protein
MAVSYVLSSRMMSISSGHALSSNLLGKGSYQGFYHAHLHLILERSPFRPIPIQNCLLTGALTYKLLLHAAFSTFGSLCLVTPPFGLEKLHPERPLC